MSIPTEIDCENPAGEPVLDVADVVALEKSIEASGTSLLELMKRAGASIADLVMDERGGNEGASRVVAVCGSGNNGGDGWVAASILAGHGFEASVVTSRMPEELTAEPARTAAKEAADGAGLSVSLNPDSKELHDLLDEADFVIDAILGTGFNGSSIKEPYADWIRAMNEAHGYVVAADVPSGVSAQTGAAADPSVIADATVTMLTLKPGLLADASSHCIGTLYLADLDNDTDD